MGGSLRLHPSRASIKLTLHASPAILIFWAFDFDLNDAALLYASATLVAILPEAAIVLITVTMAISTRRMASAKAIVRKMTALEQLGKVTDICSDKTGTLTEGGTLLCLFFVQLPNH